MSPLYHVAQLHGRLNLSIVPLAVDKGLNVQGVYIFERPFPKSGKNLVIQVAANALRVFPIPHHLLFVIPLPNSLTVGFVLRLVRFCFASMAGDLPLATCAASSSRFARAALKGRSG